MIHNFSEPSMAGIFKVILDLQMSAMFVNR